LSTWAGIDGESDGDLIRAGVQEMYDPATGFVYLLPWWEILPAAETPISGMSVLPGDSMTVTISQLSGTDWAIELTNNSTGASFVTDQTYTGPGSSVEWIAEAPTVDGSISTLADCTPDNTFTDVGVTGPQNVLVEKFMVQRGVEVSTPSALNASGFSVAYGDVAPSPPWPNMGRRGSPIVDERHLTMDSATLEEVAISVAHPARRHTRPGRRRADRTHRVGDHRTNRAQSPIR